MIEIKAFAKINRSFQITKTLPNGYHEIYSIFQAVDLFDTITIVPTKKNSVLTGSIVCSTDHNLVIEAKARLEAYTGNKMPCAINLQKAIPIAAGLGGGSSDAAAVLIGLNTLYALRLSKEELIAVGLEVGSDVPFFIANHGAALVEGVGEKIRPESGKNNVKFYVLARPHKRISASSMYSLYDSTGMSFFEICIAICPAVGELHDHFTLLSIECGMSGSGPTIFAGFETYEEATEAMQLFGIDAFDGDFFLCEPVANTYEETVS